MLPIDDVERFGIGLRNLSVGALGITPFVSAAFVVELVSLLRRSWRRSRVSGEEVRIWDKAALAAGVVTATVQALGVSYMLEGLFVDTLGGFFQPEFSRPLVIGALVMGALFHLGLARVIERWGVGNGFAWLLCLRFVQDMVADGEALVRTGESLLEPALMVLALVGGFVVVLTSTPIWERLQARGLKLEQRASRRVPLLRMFPCGHLVGFSALAVALDVPARHSSTVELLLIWPLGLLAAVLFQPAARVAGLRKTLGVSRAGRQQVVSLRTGYAVLTIALLSLLILLTDSFPEVGRWVLVLPLTCFLVDLVQEMRASMLGLTVRIRWFQRVYAADAAVEMLALAEIPAFVRGVHFRVLSQTFGPYLPLALFVQPSDAERAGELIRKGFSRESIG
ncbi:MAG: hypothetical protein R3B07_34260 [Polyangiaceae bacterium]